MRTETRPRQTAPTPFDIPSEARNLSFFSWAQFEERLLASLGMTKYLLFSQPVNHQPAYFHASSARLTAIGSEVLLITTQRKGNSLDQLISRCTSQAGT
jgi:hypothetical protein